MANIVLSQPGGDGTITADGQITTGIRCYLSASGVTASTWTVTTAPPGSAAVAKLHSRLGWYFDPDVDGDYTITMVDTVAGNNRNTFSSRIKYNVAAAPVHHTANDAGYGASIDDTSMITGDISMPEYRNSSGASPPYSAIFLYPNQALTRATFRSAHQLNPNSGATGTGRWNVLFTVPYTSTWSVIVPAAMPSGTSTMKLLFYDSNLSTVLTSQVVNLTTQEQSFSLSYSGFIPGNYYLAEAQVNDSSQQANPYMGKWRLAPSTFGTGVFAKPWKRIRAHGAMLSGTSVIASWNSGNFMQHSPHAELSFTSNCTTYAVETFVNNAGAAGQLSYAIDGLDVDVGAALADAKLNIEQRTVTTLVTGEERRHTVRAGPAGGNQLGTFFRALYLPADASFSIAPVTGGKKLCIVGDSIANGSLATIPLLQGWGAWVRRRYPGTTVFDTFPSRTFYQEANSAALYKAFALKLAQLQLTDLWLALGVNDKLTAPWTAAAFGTNYALFLDFFHGLSPWTRVWCQSPINGSAATEAANGLGDTLGAFRTQIHTAAADPTRVPWCNKVDGSGATGVSAGFWPGTGDLNVDGVHPVNSGHGKIGMAAIIELNAGGALA